MRLDDLDPSENVRDLGSGNTGGGFGGGGFPIFGLLPLLLGRRMGCGTIGLLVVVGIVYLAMSGGGSGLLSGGGSSVAPTYQGSTAGKAGAGVCNTQERLFSCRVLTSTEQVWGRIFEENGKRYQPPTLNFFEGSTESRCGGATSAAGPFYCPGDQSLYLDTSFFNELRNRFGATGDFAEAYVIAHEVGHHVQTLTGVSQQVSYKQQRVGEAEGNALSVRLELQADCFAGVWAKQSGRLEPGDIEEGMTAAHAIGDDTLQRQAQGTVVPDSFTHGTSEQRMSWLRRGLETGDPAQCDTFSANIG